MTSKDSAHEEWDAEFEYARQALQGRAWAESATLFERYVALHPGFAPAWANLSLAYRGLGDTAKQLAAARRAYELDSKAESSFTVLGEALLSSGLYAEALTCAQHARRSFPSDAWFSEIIAKAHEGLGQPEKAIAAARKAIRQSPFFNIIMHGLVADNLRNLGKLDAAIKEYDRIIQDQSLVPGTVGGDPRQEALSGKAIALLLKALRERTDTAWEDVRLAGQVALERNSRDVRALAAAGVAHRHLAEFELSFDYLERAIKAGERDPYLSLHRGMTLYELGRPEQSLDDLDFAIANATDDSIRHQALTYRPLALIRMERLDETLQACDDAIAAGVDNAIIRNTRGLVYLLRDDDLEASARELEKAREHDPDDPVVLTNLGWLALQRKEFATADELLDRAVEIAERHPSWGGWKVWVTKYLSLVMQQREGQIEGHVERMRAALKSFPNIIERVLDEMGRVTLQHELALASSRIQELEATEASVSSVVVSLDAYRRRLSSLEELLAKEGVGEEEVKQFLKSEASRFIFGLDCVRVRTEHELGDDFAADFVLEYPSQRYVFVEIENPRHRLYTQRGNPTAALTHARQQVEDWQEWVEQNNPYAQNKLPGCASPEGLVVIGRRTTLTVEDSRRLERANINSRGRLRIITYDDLLESARLVIKNLDASMAEEPD